MHSLPLLTTACHAPSEPDHDFLESGIKGQDVLVKGSSESISGR